MLDDATTEEVQVTVLYTSRDVDGQATATDVRSILAEAGLHVRPGESLAAWRLDRGGVSYQPAVGFGFGGPAHVDLVVVILDWLTPALAVGGTLFMKGLLEAAGKDAWTALKAGIIALKQRRSGKRPARGVWLILPVPTSQGVRWIGFQLPPLTEDLTGPLAQLENVKLPPLREGYAVIWLKWDRHHRRWR